MMPDARNLTFGREGRNVRLDQCMVARGLCESRAKAQDLIRSGAVSVAGKVVTRPAHETGGEETIGISSDVPAYVGRAALKLKPVLTGGLVDVGGKRCLDVGASTGGFTQVMLEFGAASVVALDVGSGQLHPSLRADPRVVSRENCDLRRFDDSDGFDVVTADVSFISLVRLLPDLDRLARGTLVLLFKPQFEVGPDARRTRAGVVTDIAAVAAARRAFEGEAARIGWRLVSAKPSDLPGRDGNLEYVYVFDKTARLADSPIAQADDSPLLMGRRRIFKSE
ncbi:MAG: 16S/23S rRNA (cytidine-2'-O)-methyltransferase TlyA [bacterium ADurb.Bin374]|nr:MAG: 16S/23S rRNA (cytidine-2'-O)-methyltransferase TlyA [bacterium ADurb.Bin374]